MMQLVQQQAIGLNQPALNEWIEYRREDSKKPMSQRAVDKVVKKLLQWSEEDQQRIVDHAIEHEWQGLYWIDPPRQQTTRQTTLAQDLTDTSWAQ